MNRIVLKIIGSSYWVNQKKSKGKSQNQKSFLHTNVLILLILLILTSAVPLFLHRMATDNIKQRTTQTHDLLKKAKSGTVEPNDIDALRDVLRFHESRYYILNDPLVSDFEYDQLYKGLEKLETENPDLITPDSPTQRVGKSLTKDFPTVQHLVPMLSLQNSYNSDDLIDFDRKARELTGMEKIEYCVEPKFDGASISLIYENDKLVRGATRGNGVQGDDITPNIRQIRTIPLTANFAAHGLQTVEIRGEVLINKAAFKKFNDTLIEQGSAPLANPRNAASGSLRIKDPMEVSRRKLEAFTYHISYYTLSGKDGEPTKHSETLELLWDLGFRSPEKEKKVLQGIDAVVDYCNNFEKERDNLPYEIDGMVIKVNDFALQDKLGMTTHHPRWAIAYKFAARQATSTLLRVEYQVGRTGNIGPVAKIEPVPIGGVTVGSISLFNEDNIRDKDIRIGDTVLVERAGDVIPYIVKSFPELRTGLETEIHFPTHCPSCGDELYRVEEEAAWRCTNMACPAQLLERLLHFTSRNAMDIRGLGEAIIQKFYSMGFLKSLPGIYTLPYETIGALEGFGKKSIDNLKAAVEGSKTQPLHRLIFALGIRFIGETTAKVLAHAVNHLLELKNFTEEQLKELEDIGPKVASSVFTFFQNDDNIKTLQALEALGLNLSNDRKTSNTSGNLHGLSFLFTGTMTQLKRSEAEEKVEAQGGAIATGVSSKLSYLVVGEDAGSKLEKAKKISSVKIISEAEFLKLVEG